MPIRLHGLSAFPITPATPDGRIDTGALGRLLDRLVAAGVDSIGLLGSTGGYPYFTGPERRRAVQAAVECVAGRVPVLVGVGSLRTDDAVERAREAREAGADAGLLAPVSYAPLTDDEVFGLFETVAGTGLDLCVYNNPGTTHFTVSPALLGRLANIPGVVAAKNPAPPAADCAAAVAASRTVVPAGFSVGFSVDLHAPAALLAGGDAWYSVLGGIAPATCLRITRAAQAGDAAAVERLHANLEPVWRLFSAHSAFRVVHHLAGRLGIAPAAPQRPVLPLSEAARREVDQVAERIALD